MSAHPVEVLVAFRFELTMRDNPAYGYRYQQRYRWAPVSVARRERVRSLREITRTSGQDNSAKPSRLGQADTPDCADCWRCVGRADRFDAAR